MRKLPFHLFAAGLVAALLTGVCAPVLAQRSIVTAQVISNLNVRSGPGVNYEILAQLPRGAIVIVEGRNLAGDWLRVHTENGAVDGWATSRYLALLNGADLSALTVVSGEVVGPREVAELTTAEFLASVTVDELLARLQNTPVLPSISERTHAIYRVGQVQGRRPNVFSKVGDCMTDSDSFLLPFGVGEYDLGPYADLQATIDYFSAVSPRPADGVANSFVNDSMAAYTGFNAAAVLDPSWSDPTHCNAGEVPLECEYRLVNPGVALVMFGAVDMQYMTAEAFAFYMRQIVWLSIDRGIIPVLSTFPSSPNYHWEDTIRFNGLVLEIARQEQVPLINFWLATRTLPNFGLEPDYFHLAYNPEGRRMSFNGDEAVWGFTLRNLLTLQMLDELRRNVFYG